MHMIAHLTFSVLSWSNMEKLCPRNYFQQVESRSDLRTSYERTETTSKGALASFVSDPCDSKGHFSPRPKSQEEDDWVELKNSWLNVNFTSGRQSTGKYHFRVLCWVIFYIQHIFIYNLIWIVIFRNHEVCIFKTF